MGLRMQKYMRMGSNVCAMIMLTKSTMLMAHGNIFRKSCMTPVIVMRKGKNVIEMQSVAEKMLFKKWSVASTALRHRVMPSARLLT